MRTTGHSLPIGGRRAAAKALIVFLGACRLLSALNPNLLISQYIHTGWASRDGFELTSVTAIAQTPDGYLWLGTEDGLMRFDGLNFLKWRTGGGAAPLRVTTLLASRVGDLWIGTESGLVHMNPNSRVEPAMVLNLPRSVILCILEDRAGDLWVGTNHGLVVLHSGSVKTFGAREGLPSPIVYSLAQDVQDHIWIGTAEGVCEWPRPAEVGCRPVGPRSPAYAIRHLPDKRSLLLAGHFLGLLDMPEGRLNPMLNQSGSSTAAGFRTLLIDGDANIWTGVFGAGLMRIKDGRVDQFRMRNGLTGDLVQAIFEDREGNVWIGTSNGLDRFRSPKVTRVSTIEGLSGNLCTAVCSTRDGSIWVGVSGSGLDRVGPESITHYSLASVPGHSITTFTLHQDAQGTLWAGTNLGLFYRSGPRFIRLRPPGLDMNQVIAIAEGENGSLWVADVRDGLLQLRNGRSLTPRGATRRKEGDVYQLHADHAGRLWIGYFQGGLTILEKGAARYYGHSEGLAPGAVQCIFEDSLGVVWVGTTQGLSRFRNAKWTTWGLTQGLPPGEVQGIVESHGALWTISGSALVRLERSRLDACADGAPNKLEALVFARADGIQLPARRSMVNPRIAPGADGRIWVGTGDGLATLDPGTLRPNLSPGPVLIDQVLVDGRPVDLSRAPLAYRGRDLQIQFGAVSLGVPEIVRFRHKLTGRDNAWSAPDNARRIVYADLPPGRYRFSVVAANSNGPWTDRPAELDIERQAYFYQTRLFYLCCVCVLGLFAYASYFLRIKELHARFRLAMEERTRMARELHDTLVQGFAGVVYFLAAASRQADSGQKIDKDQLRRAVEQADESLKEAREAISCMRMSSLEDGSLARALIDTGNQIFEDTTIRFSSEVKGPERHLEYETQANLYIIGREAMTNAARHSRATHIFVEITFHPDAVHLLIRDDGVGFDPAVIPNKHWGVLGMRERAKHIGARLEISTSPGRGTIIEVWQQGAKARTVNPKRLERSFSLRSRHL